MRIIYTLAILFFCVKTYGQEKNFIDQPHLETNAKIDTLIVPDRIFITIILNEADSKNKKSTEELEKALEKSLKNLNINTEKDLSLLDYSSDFKNLFLKGQNILKTKNYSLLVHDALTASKVLTALEEEGISNVNIERTEYSKAEELILELKSKAVKKAKINAQKLLEPLGQKLGKAIFISDNNSITNALQGQVKGIQIRGASSIYGSRASEPMLVEFQKIKFETQVIVKFIID
jgi:uncharacterized protein YggE